MRGKLLWFSVDDRKKKQILNYFYAYLEHIVEKSYGDFAGLLERVSLEWLSVLFPLKVLHFSSKHR